MITHTIVALATALTPTVAWIGDSISWSEQPTIETGMAECGYDVHLDTLPGRTLTSSDTVFGRIPSGLDAIAQLEATVDPDVWVIEQGLNDIHMGFLHDEAGMRDAVDAVRAIIDNDDEIVWVTTYSGQEAYTAHHDLFNEVLRSEVAVADWAAVAASTNLDDAGIHPDADGMATMVSLVCGALDTPRPVTPINR